MLTLKINKKQSNKNDVEFNIMRGIREVKNFYFQSIPLKNSKNYNNFEFLTDIVQQSSILSIGSHFFMPTR